MVDGVDLVACIPYFLTPCLYLSHMSRISAVLNLIFSIYIFLEWSDRKVVERAETTEDEVHDDNIEVEDVESDNTVEDKETGNKDSDSEEGIKRTTLEMKLHSDTETEETNKYERLQNKEE